MFCAVAHAFGVAPIRLDLDRATRSDTISISNEADTAIAIEVRAVEWTQDELGFDRYLDTRDLIYFPQQLTIPAGESRAVRVGYRNPALGSEKAYRLYIEQRTQAPATHATEGPGERRAQIPVTVRFGVPVFLRPDKPAQRGALAGPTLTRGEVQTEVRNTGNVHFRIGEVRFSGFDASGAETFAQSLEGWYLLSGATRRYRLPVAGDPCRRTVRVRVEVLAEKLRLAEEAPSASDSCP